jgi:ligand-binding sensor domain-containing protein
LWIGTNEGPVLAHNPAAVFNADYRFSRVKIPRNDGTDLADYLLKDVRINCIAVDGANRKWLGTEGDGLYVLSPDGTETIHRFSSENSPLPSDYIQSITLHPETGEAFIGTSAAGLK